MHVFSAPTGARELADLRRPLGRVPLIEALSGRCPRGTTSRLGSRAFTTVAGARTKEEFLAAAFGRLENRASGRRSSSHRRKPDQDRAVDAGLET